jgi:hypothetical protein
MVGTYYMYVLCVCVCGFPSDIISFKFVKYVVEKVLIEFFIFHHLATVCHSKFLIHNSQLLTCVNLSLKN